MDYPESLVKEVNIKSQDFLLEGFMSGYGDFKRGLFIVGEAPGKTELVTGLPFTGQAGKYLDSWLRDADFKRSDFYISSSLKSRPYKIREHTDKKTGIISHTYPNRTPSKKEILVHAKILDYEIKTLNPKILLPMGNIGLKRLLGNNYRISEWHGKYFKSKILETDVQGEGYKFSEEEYLIYPLYHPAAALYNPKLAIQGSEDLKHLAELLAEDTCH